MHLPKLAAVTFIKNDDAVFPKYLMPLIFRYKVIQFLDGGDNDFVLVKAAFFVLILQLSLQNFRRSIAVGRTFLKTIVLLHGLIVQIFSIHHKQHLVHIRQGRGKLCCFERSQCLAASCSVPDITAGINSTCFSVVGGNFDAVQNPLCGGNLIGAHNHQDFFGGKDTILCQHIQNGVFRKECFSKVDQIPNDFIFPISPKACELKAIAGFLGFFLCRLSHFFDMAVSGSIGIILGMGSIGNDENLHILIQSTGCPKAVPLISFDLVESFPDGDATAFQFRMDKGQTVHQNGHVIAGIVAALVLLILVDDLQAVVMDVLFVDELNIFRCSVIPTQYLYMVGLDGSGFFHNALIGIGKGFRKETLPFPIGKGVVIEKFQLVSEIFNQARFTVNGKIFISLRFQQVDEFLFQSCFALKGVGVCAFRHIFRYNGAFVGFGNYIILTHVKTPYKPLIFLFVNYVQCNNN